MKKKSKLLIIVAVLLVVAAGAVAAVRWRQNYVPQIQSFVTKETVQQFTQSTAETSAVQQVLGYGTPRTYLVLLLNNTELRPGGGFIGAYAVVQFNEGVPKLLKIEGTEILDNSAPYFVTTTPPDPLKKYLQIPYWQFRDSNWSPDFSSSAVKALDLFRRENGTAANNIDGVAAFTPTVMEELLKITGPITVDGQQWTSSNFTDQLEYEVEYGYAGHGLSFNDRKQTLIDLAHAILPRIAGDVFQHWSDYTALFPRMLAQKQIALYSIRPAEEAIMAQKQWGGLMNGAPGDYLMWVDANLGSLKTDAVMERSLSYAIKPASSTYVGTVTMRLVNKGTITWRTTRYRDYARVYVPSGSILLGATGAMVKEGSTAPGTIDQGQENGRQWFGAFIDVEPGAAGALSFQFELAPSVVAQIKSKHYTLLAQKQIGTLAPLLTLGLEFGDEVIFGHPGEPIAKHGDSRYDLVTDLSVDREFTVGLK